MSKETKLLGVKEAIELTGYSRGHIYRLIRHGQLPCHKPAGGRLFFKKNELLDFVYGNKKSAAPVISARADSILNGEVEK